VTQQPADADAVLRDDALLDAVARGDLPSSFSDDPTARLLLAWRNDVAPTDALSPEALVAMVAATASEDTIGIPVPDDATLAAGAAGEGAPGDATQPATIGLAARQGRHEADAGQRTDTGAPPTPGRAAVLAAHARGLLGGRGSVTAHARRLAGAGSGPRWRGISRRAAVAAGIGVLAVGGIGSVAGASVAEPGDPLWPITKVVYTERAESLEARQDALSALREAREAADRNEPEQARRLLDTAMQESDRVREGDEKAQLRKQVAEVQQQLAAMGVAGPPTAPASPSAPASPPPTAPPSLEPAPTSAPPPVPTPTSPGPPTTPDPTQPVSPPPPPPPPPSSPPTVEPSMGASNVQTESPTPDTVP
jgi:hypothetical protein